MQTIKKVNYDKNLEGLRGSCDFSTLDTEETISKLQNATYVAGAHGAGFSNIYLCRPGTRVLEIYPDGAGFQPCYQRLAVTCALYHNIMYLDFKNKDNAETGFHAFQDAFSKFIC